MYAYKYVLIFVKMGTSLPNIHLHIVLCCVVGCSVLQCPLMNFVWATLTKTHRQCSRCTRLSHIQIFILCACDLWNYSVSLSIHPISDGICRMPSHSIANICKHIHTRHGCTMKLVVNDI